MAVSIGKGRYYKLFAGNSPPKRLLIEDINEPGLLSDEYVQGVVIKVFPVKNSGRFGKLCKLVLKEDVEKAARHAPCATINVFLLGDVADEGESVCEGDRMVLTEAIAECSPTNEHHFQLIVWREKSDVSVWIISKRGKVKANTVNGVDILHRSTENGGEFEKGAATENGNDSEEEEHVIYQSCEYDFTQQSVDDEQPERVGEKRKGKFQLGPRGVTPSHVKRSFNNVVVLRDKVNDVHVAKTLQHEESYTKSKSTCTNASAELNAANVNASGNTANIALPSVAVEAGRQSMLMSQKAAPGGNGQSVSLCLQSANGTPEQPHNVQCTRIELTPSGVSTRIWNSPGTCFQSGQVKDPCQFGAMPLRDLPQLMAIDSEGQSQSTVGESNVTASVEGANTAAKTAAFNGDGATSTERTSALNDDNTNLSLDDMAEEPYVISPEEEDKIFLRARNRKGDDPATTSSVKGLMPSDYTPAASLLMCSKDDVQRSPLRQVLDPKRRLPTTPNSEAGPSQPSPSRDRSPVKAFPVRVRKRSSHATADYTVPPGYTTLANLQPETTVNVYGVVKLFKPAWKCRGTDMCSVLMLMDPTAAESGGLECVSFQPSVSRLPDVHKVGDIVRLHRIKINQYQGRLQAKSSRGFAAVVFDRDADLPVTAEMARVSSSTFTLTQSDKDTVECLKNWCDDHPVLFPPSNFLTVSQINPDCYFDLVCQVLGIALHRTLDCVVLYVTDGTQPKHDLRNCDGDDYSLIEPLSRGSTQDDDVISVFLYGSHAEVARLLAKQDEFVILHNVHSQVLKAGGSVCSVLDVVKPYLELCLHRGTAFGRGLSVLSPDSQEVMQINRRKGL